MAQIHSTCIDLLNRIKCLKQETFWIDTLGSKGLKIKCSQYILEPTERNRMVTVMIRLSRTGNMASRIINKHFKIHKRRGYSEHY